MCWCRDPNLWHFWVELSTDLRSIGVWLGRLIVEAVERLRHLLLRDEGLRLFTDHRKSDIYLRSNLERQWFQEVSCWQAMPIGKQTVCYQERDRAYPWRFQYMGWYRLKIERRWRSEDLTADSKGSSMEWSMSSCKWTVLLAWSGWDHRRTETFSWLGRRGIQRRFRQKVLLNPKGRVWISNSKLLRQSICIIVHCGVNGRRGRTPTLTAIKPFFYWDCLDEDVKQFCRMCLHCIGSLDSKVARPLGEALHAWRRNQVIHYDLQRFGCERQSLPFCWACSFWENRSYRRLTCSCRLV